MNYQCVNQMMMEEVAEGLSVHKSHNDQELSVHKSDHDRRSSQRIIAT